MRRTSWFRLALAVSALSVAVTIGGCGMVSVQMTSTEGPVRNGDPVTFDITLTNHSPCPLDNTVAILVPFITQAEFAAQFNQIPPDAPEEILEFIKELMEFADELCAGGTPPFPTPPEEATAASDSPRINADCEFEAGAISCEFSMFVRGAANNLSFGLFEDRMQCTANDGFVRCGLQVPVGQQPAPSATTSAVVQQLNCFTAQDLGGGQIIVEGGEVGAVCALGTLPDFQGLGGGVVAAGQIVLPARGAGPMRNFVFVVSTDPDEAGVCQGGADDGQACDLDSGSDCTGGTCSPGVCVGGGNDGSGCDADGDCGGGDCQLCAVEYPPMALPIDCTVTYISPEGAPAASPWGVAVLALALLAGGMLWLRRRPQL